MGLQVVPGYIGQAAYEHPVELFRNLTKALTGKGTGLLADTTGFAMTPSGSLMQLTVAAGFAVLAGVENASQGSYFVWSEASEVLAWPAHSGSPRIDSLILRVIDTQYGTDPDTPQAEWEIVQGTPSGSPVAVADIEFASGGDNYRPGAWWRVADVLVEVADTIMSATTITDYRKLANVNDQRASTGSLFLQRVIYTSGGTFSKANYPNAKKVNVKVTGGGGAGASAEAATAGSGIAVGSGGGGGGYAESWLDVSALASSVTVTVGAGGAAAAAGLNNGNSGSTSSFGATVVATGGTGGISRAKNTVAYSFAEGSVGGIGTAGDILVRGGPGGHVWSEGSLGISGCGGNAAGPYGGGGGISNRNQSASTQFAGNPGISPGAGGSGALSANTGTAQQGGAGAAGIVVVDVYV